METLISIVTKRANQRVELGFGMKRYGSGWFKVALPEVSRYDTSKFGEPRSVVEVSVRTRKAYELFVERLMAAHDGIDYEGATSRFPFVTKELWDYVKADMKKRRVKSDTFWYDDDVKKSLLSDWQFMSEFARGNIMYCSLTEEFKRVFRISQKFRYFLVYEYRLILEMFNGSRWLESDTATGFNKFIFPVMQNLSEKYRYWWLNAVNAEITDETSFCKLIEFVGFLLDREDNLADLRDNFNEHMLIVEDRLITKLITQLNGGEYGLGLVICPEDVNLGWLHYRLKCEGITVDSIVAEKRAMLCRVNNKPVVTGDELATHVANWLAGLKSRNIRRDKSLLSYIGNYLLRNNVVDIINYSRPLMEYYKFTEETGDWHLSGVAGDFPDIILSNDRRRFYLP